MPFAEQPPTPPALEMSAFDLTQIDGEADRIAFRIIAPRCPKPKPNEIVVCATDPERERARDLPTTYGEGDALPRAEIDVGKGANLDVHLDAAALPNGYTANRILVGAKIKF